MKHRPDTHTRRDTLRAVFPPAIGRESTTMLTFSGRDLFVGFGAVARCTLPILLQHIAVDPARITVMDFEWDEAIVNPGPNEASVSSAPASLPENLPSAAERASVGERPAHRPGVEHRLRGDRRVVPRPQRAVREHVGRALGSVSGSGRKHPTERTLYWRHMNLRRRVASWKERGPTAVVEHGANPGLISHFTKQGPPRHRRPGAVGSEIPDCGRGGDRETRRGRCLQSSGPPARREGDSLQRNAIPRSPIGRKRRTNSSIPGASKGSRRRDHHGGNGLGHRMNASCRRWPTSTKTDREARSAWREWGSIRSWRAGVPPDHHIVGMVVRHGEAFTITENLTVWEDGRAVYPSDGPLRLLSVRLRDRVALRAARPRLHDPAAYPDHDRRDHQRRRHPGALVMGHAYQAWWCGSDLDIEESRRLVPHQNATTMQVAISVVAASMWMLENPRRGVCVPDDLPHDFVLNISRPYLGRFISVASDWNPLKHYANAFDGFNHPQLDRPTRGNSRISDR